LIATAVIATGSIIAVIFLNDDEDDIKTNDKREEGDGCYVKRDFDWFEHDYNDFV